MPPLQKVTVETTDVKRRVELGRQIFSEKQESESGVLIKIENKEREK